MRLLDKPIRHLRAPQGEPDRIKLLLRKEKVRSLTSSMTMRKSVRLSEPASEMENERSAPLLPKIPGRSQFCDMLVINTVGSEKKLDLEVFSARRASCQNVTARTGKDRNSLWGQHLISVAPRGDR